MADLLAYLARHPNTGPRLAMAAATVAYAMDTTEDWNADLWQFIAPILSAATGDHLPELGAGKWTEITEPSQLGDLSPARFVVTWAIDVGADEDTTPEQAAEAALEMLVGGDSTAHVFTVHDNQTCTTTVVDLDDPDNTTVLEG